MDFEAYTILAQILGMRLLSPPGQKIDSTDALVLEQKCTMVP